MRRLRIVLLLAVWGGLLVGLAERQKPDTGGPKIEWTTRGDKDGVPSPREEWFGIYQGDNKIGYSHRSAIYDNDSIAFRDDSRFHIAMLGSEQKVHTTLVARTDANHRLQRFRFRLMSDAATFSATGAVEGQSLIIKHGSGDETNRLEIPLTESLQLPVTLRSDLALWEAEAGSRFETTVLSPLTMQRERIIVRVHGRETIDGPEGPVETVHITEEQQGITSKAWISRDGDTIREEATLGFRLEREAPEVARSGFGEGNPVDLASQSRVPLHGTIHNPRERARLRLALGGAAAAMIPHDPPRQRVSQGMVEIQREGFPQPAAAVGPGPTPEHSAPALFIESDDPKIVARARAIVGEEKNPKRQAQRLVDWVSKSLVQEPSLTLPSARAVLAARRGDCNEHAVLLAALARAVGIPARIVAGVVYANDGFYYHAWNEFWLGSWVSADAIFAQIPADATHVKLLEGGPERHLDLVEIVGRLEFSTMESPS